MYIKMSRIRDVKLACRANAGDALDFFIPNDFKSMTLIEHHNVLIPSGIKVEVPFGYALQFVNKSGVAAKRNLVIGACLVDHGYAGEVHLDIHNIGHTDQVLNPGDKIAQAILIPVMVPQVIEVSETELYQEIALVSSRGTGGFGSTGSK